MNHKYGIDYDVFFNLIDNMYDEVIVYDNNYNIIYINQACVRHYGCGPNKMIGKSFYDFVHADWWGPSILPIVYNEKKSYVIRQKTFLGTDLLTIAVPYFDKNGEIEYVVMNVRDTVNEIDLWNAQEAFTRVASSSDITLIGSSREIIRIKQLVARISQLDSPCIFYGEPGVGKTVMARYLHSISKKSSASFAAFNCASLPDDKLRKELFGTKDQPGLFYKMRTGTVLLQNIYALSLETQNLLLEYIERENSPGDWDDQSARILVSSNIDLKNLVRSGKLLASLYYKLSVSEVYIPPLRKRREDIRPIIEYFIGYYGAKYHENKHFTEGAMKALIHADWPSNVRELRYTIERLLVMTDNPVIDTAQLPPSVFGVMDIDAQAHLEPTENFDKRMENFESCLIRDAYEKYGSSRKIAEHLGISQSKANNLLRKYIRQNDGITP